ncbi:MAG: hypothetical protein WD604_04105 [Balneolaceae bacterium]
MPKASLWGAQHDAILSLPGSADRPACAEASEDRRNAGDRMGAVVKSPQGIPLVEGSFADLPGSLLP